MDCCFNANIKILRIDSSARGDGSEARALSDGLIGHIEATAKTTVTHRDLAVDTPNFLNEAWVGANFTDPDGRSAAQAADLAVSDALVAELEAEDVIVIGAPIYNFSIPAVLKAWIDLIARAKVTFRYGENGPEGLLKNKKVYVMMASDGVPTARWIYPRLLSGTFLVLLALRMWSSFLPPKSKRIRVGWLQRSGPQLHIQQAA